MRVLALLLLLAAPAAAQAPAVLTRADITYRCSVAFPRAIDGKDSLYTMSGLALRRVGGALHAFTSLGGDIIEFRLSESCATPPVFVKNHGRIWVPWEGEGQSITALYFRQLADDGSGQLWALHSYFYAVTGEMNPHASVAVFDGAAYVSSAGPFTFSGPNVTYNKTRSGLTGWMDGRILIGAGGHFAGVSSASLGLFAGTFAPLVLGTGPGVLGVVPLVDHPYDAAHGWPTSAARLGDYSSAGLPTSPDAGTWPQPANGVGRWQYYDGIDSFVYITTGAKHGLIAFGEEATGPITYDAGGSCTGCQFKTYWRIFDPAKVAANQGKTLEPASYFRVGPGEFGSPDYGRVLFQHKDGQNLPLQTGAAYDGASRLLVKFVAKGPKTSPTAPDYERLPALDLYVIGPAPEPVPPPPPPPVVWPGEVRSACTKLKDGSCNFTINLPGTTGLGRGAKVEVKK